MTEINKRAHLLSNDKATHFNDYCIKIVEFSDPVISSVIWSRIRHYYKILNKYQLPKSIVKTIRPLIIKQISLDPNTSYKARQEPFKTPTKSKKGGLQPGDLVQIRSWEEISKTLDKEGKNRGLYFMPFMKKYCGKQFKVLKVIKKIKLDDGLERRMRAPTVFLEGAYCDGIGTGCDRTCFLFWREKWLQRITPST